MQVSPIVEEIFSNSISSGVFTTRASEIAGQPLTMLIPLRWNAANDWKSRMSIPILPLSGMPFSLRTSTIESTMRSTM